MGTVLHVGCGRKRPNAAELLASVGLAIPSVDGFAVTHVDAEAHLSPDIVCRVGTDRLSVDDNSIDVIVAKHVLEHIGRQGESREWFAAMEDLYRVLTPNGLMVGECPYYDSIWAWSDPTHRRAISEHSFVFFMQAAYRAEGSIISPYRIRTDFQWVSIAGMPNGHTVVTGTDPRDRSLRFALMAQKPLRPWWED